MSHLCNLKSQMQYTYNYHYIIIFNPRAQLHLQPNFILNQIHMIQIQRIQHLNLKYTIYTELA